MDSICSGSSGRRIRIWFAALTTYPSSPFSFFSFLQSLTGVFTQSTGNYAFIPFSSSNPSPPTTKTAFSFLKASVSSFPSCSESVAKQVLTSSRSSSEKDFCKALSQNEVLRAAKKYKPAIHFPSSYCAFAYSGFSVALNFGAMLKLAVTFV